MPINRRLEARSDARVKRFSVLMDIPTHERLHQEADLNAMSANEYIRVAITEKARDQERYGPDYLLVRSLMERLPPADVVQALSAASAAQKGGKR